MAMYRKKDSVVEARRVESSLESLNDLCLWVNSGRTWADSTHAWHNGKFAFLYGRAAQSVHVGHYIVRHSNGATEALTASEFADRYESIAEPDSDDDSSPMPPGYVNAAGDCLVREVMDKYEKPELDDPGNFGGLGRPPIRRS